MISRSHALTGVLAASGTSMALHLDVPQFLLALSVLPGLALLPDIDHPSSTVTRSAILPFHLLFEHRKQTHSFFGVLVFSISVHFAVYHLPNLFAAAWVVGVMAMAWVSVLRVLRIRSIWPRLATTPIAALVVFNVPLSYFPLLVAIGMLTHILGDVLTIQGCSLLWPFTNSKFALGLFRAGGRFETWFMFPLLVLSSVIVSVWYFI